MKVGGKFRDTLATLTTPSPECPAFAKATAGRVCPPGLSAGGGAPATRPLLLAGEGASIFVVRSDAPVTKNLGGSGHIGHPLPTERLVPTR